MPVGDAGVLDEAFERMRFAGFELPNGFVNHGPMACEALEALDRTDEIDRWAKRFSSTGGEAIDPAPPRDIDWPGSLGRYGLLPQWIGLFELEIREKGWRSVVALWVPRLMPAFSTALFHGAIRTAHAIRATEASETEPRLIELSRSLGYWAARFRPGIPTDVIVSDEDPAVDLLQAEVLDSAASGARFYLADPDIFNLHGVTGAMALQILVPHIAPSDAAAAVAQLQAEHAVLYEGITPSGETDVEGFDPAEAASAAVSGRDPHQVKLVEACLRGRSATGDPAFAAAAAHVTRRSRNRG
jgi:hypothetical protein